jgi:muramidase (phage lysozyme)
MPRSLLDLIASVESPGYDVAYGGTKMPAGMTLQQTLAWQKSHGQKTGSSAVGRYQFIRPTLQGLMKESGLPLKTQFTPAVQDMLATKLIERRGLNDYVSGKLPPERFARNLSQEWAGLPSGPEGRSYYAGDQMGNKAGVGWDQVIRTLDRPDVRMAANTTGSTDTDRTPSGGPAPSPKAGRPRPR